MGGVGSNWAGPGGSLVSVMSLDMGAGYNRVFALKFFKDTHRTDMCLFSFSYYASTKLYKESIKRRLVESEKSRNTDSIPCSAM